MNSTLSLRVPQGVIEQFRLLAEATGKSRNFLVVQAMQDFIDREAWQIAEVKQALIEANAGDFATDEEMAEMNAKWGYNAY